MVYAENDAVPFSRQHYLDGKARNDEQFGTNTVAWAKATHRTIHPASPGLYFHQLATYGVLTHINDSKSLGLGKPDYSNVFPLMISSLFST